MAHNVLLMLVAVCAVCQARNLCDQLRPQNVTLRQLKGFWVGVAQHTFVSDDSPTPATVEQCFAMRFSNVTSRRMDFQLSLPAGEGSPKTFLVAYDSRRRAYLRAHKALTDCGKVYIVAADPDSYLVTVVCGGLPMERPDSWSLSMVVLSRCMPGSRGNEERGCQLITRGKVQQLSQELANSLGVASFEPQFFDTNCFTQK